MDQARHNKEFVIGYFNSLSRKPKTREVIDKYVNDPPLVEHILFFDSIFPNYEIIVDDMIGEGSKVFVRCRFRGRHEGEFNGIPATGKEVEFPFAIGYEIENDKIIHHWLIADQAILMEQLGVADVQA